MRSFGRPKRRLEDNIKMELKYEGTICVGFIWIMIETNGGLL
jgi:hypothetical protein